MPERSVIQMTAAKHAKSRDEAISVSRLHYMLLTESLPTDAELDAYHRGMEAAWKFCTFSILRDGNCKFEKGE